MLDATMLIAGARGRRMLLTYVIESHRATDPEFSNRALLEAILNLSYELDPGKGESRVMLHLGDGEPEHETFGPQDVAELLSVAHLEEPSQELLRLTLKSAVDSAHAYQEPDGEDFLTATLPVKDALMRVAEHIAVSPLTDWWTATVDLDDQWARHWQVEFGMQFTTNALAVLQAWGAKPPPRDTRPFDPDAKISAQWWSIPPADLVHTARRLYDGSPAGIWFSEDAGGENEIVAERVMLSDSVRVCEVNDAEAWADLCRRFPLDVTDATMHDWYRATGRHGRWVIPNWTQVAREYDGVHLTVAGYLSASNIEIPVNDTHSSVIAGWNPDETWWFINPQWTGETSIWVMDERWHGHGWSRRGDDPTAGKSSASTPVR